MIVQDLNYYLDVQRIAAEYLHQEMKERNCRGKIYAAREGRVMSNSSLWLLLCKVYSVRGEARFEVN